MQNPNPQNPVAPFSCRYSSQVPELLQKLNCTIAISTYQAGKLVFISAKDENNLIQLPRNFDKPMGIAIHPSKDKLALACKEEVVVFANSPQLAAHYPKAPSKYDAMYLPRMTYHTGAIDMHDLSFGNNDELYGVNTLFSCISKIDSDYNFTPYWTPPFVTDFVSEDRCHLNGMALQNGLPKYVTAFNQGNTFQSWRETLTTSGIIMDVASNEIITEGLGMPHSPRLFGNDLFLLQSAKGELTKVDVQTGKQECILKMEGFVRGMSLHNNYLFIGFSKLRQNSSTFGKLDFAEKANEAAILIVHLPTASIAGKITYLTSLDEIYDVHILPNKIRPNILNTRTEDHKAGLMTPNATFWAKPKEQQ